MPEIPVTTPLAKIDRPVLSVRDLTGPIGDFVRKVTDKSNLNPAGVLLATKVCVGAALNCGAYLQDGYLRHGPLLFAVTVARQAGLHQSDFLGPVHALFRTVAARTGKTLVSYTPIGLITSGEKLLDASAGGDHQRSVVAFGQFDTTWRLLPNLGNKLVVGCREAWENSTRISILGHLTESNLSCGRMTDITLDVASYFLWANVGAAPSNSAPQVLPDNDIDSFAQTIAKAAQRANGRGAMVLNGQALKLLADVYQDPVTLGSEAISIITSRQRSHVGRLALINALVEGAGEVEASHLKAALAEWAFFRSSAEFLFGYHVTDPLMQRVLDALSIRDLSQTGLHGLLHNHTPATRLRALLSEMTTKGMIIAETRRNGGRPETVWRLRQNSVARDEAS